MKTLNNYGKALQCIPGIDVHAILQLATDLVVTVYSFHIYVIPYTAAKFIVLV